MPMPLVVFPAEVAGSTVGHLRIDFVWTVMRSAEPTLEAVQQQAEGLFALEGLWLTQKTAAVGVRRSRLTVSGCAKSKSQRISLC